MKGIITKIKKIWCIETNKGKTYPITNDSIYYGGFGIYKGREVEFKLEAYLTNLHSGDDNKSNVITIKEMIKKKAKKKIKVIKASKKKR